MVLSGVTASFPMGTPWVWPGSSFQVEPMGQDRFARGPARSVRPPASSEGASSYTSLVWFVVGGAILMGGLILLGAVVTRKLSPGYLLPWIDDGLTPAGEVGCKAIRLRAGEEGIEDLLATNGEMFYLIADRPREGELVIRLTPREFEMHPKLGKLAKYSHEGMVRVGDKPRIAGVLEYIAGSNMLAFNCVSPSVHGGAGMSNYRQLSAAAAATFRSWFGDSVTYCDGILGHYY